MTKRPLLLTITTFIAAALWGACGGGGSSAPAPTPTTPTVSSVTFTGGKATPSATSLSTSTAVTNFSADTSTFTITFSEAMDATTLTTSTVGFTCTGSSTNLISGITATSTTVFTATISSTLPQVTACTLTLGTGIKSSASVALSAAVAYNVTTGCTTNDNFSNSATLTDCWTVQASAAGTTAIASDALTLTTTAQVNSGQGPGVTKTFSSSATSIIQTVKITATNINENGDLCNFALLDLTGNAGAVMFIGFDGGLGKAAVGANGTIGGSHADSTPIALTADSHNTVTQYVRMSYSNAGTATTSYSATGSNFTSLTCSGQPCAFDLVPTANLLSFIETEHGPSAHTVTCSYENYTVTGATAISPPTGGQD